MAALIISALAALVATQQAPGELQLRTMTMKRFAIIAALLALFAFTASAQDAKVIQLSETDAAKIKVLHENWLNALKAYEQFKTEIEDRYAKHEAPREGSITFTGQMPSSAVLVVDSNGTMKWKASVLAWKEGWQFGVRFSADWRFIVPADPPKGKCAGVNLGNYGCLTLTDHDNTLIPLPEVKK